MDTKALIDRVRLANRQGKLEEADTLMSEVLQNLKVSSISEEHYSPFIPGSIWWVNIEGDQQVECELLREHRSTVEVIPLNSNDKEPYMVSKDRLVRRIDRGMGRSR